MTHPTSSQIVESLRQAGKRVTAERRLLFDIIAANPHLDATAIYATARKANPKIGLATVYRTLSLLAELDLVDVSALGEDHSHYEIRGEDHVHLICLRCGKVQEVPPPAGLSALDEIDGFEIQHANLELVGICKACRRKRASSGKAREGKGIRR